MRPDIPLAGASGFPVWPVWIVLGGIIAWMLIRTIRRQIERRKRLAEERENETRARLASALGCGRFGLLHAICSRLGLQDTAEGSAAFHLERLLTASPSLRASLSRFRLIVGEIAVAGERISALGGFLNREVNGRSNQLDHPLSAPERGRHRLMLRRQLADLLQVRERYDRERELFDRAEFDLLATAICRLAKHEAWEQEFVQAWQKLILPFPAIGEAAERATRVNELGHDPMIS